MVVCQFFLRGQCKFGATCRNEHPKDGQRSVFGNQSWTPTSGNQHAGASNPVAATTLFTTDSIRRDFDPAVDRPTWPLSSYGPAKGVPTLVAGLDESPEELRVKAVLAMKANTIQEYLNYETTAIGKAMQAYEEAKKNVQQLHEQAVQRYNALNGVVPPATTGTSTGSAFGSNNVLGASTGPSPFGAPASTSAFGKPSGFGAFASSGPSAFGGAASGSSAFGKPASAFGQSAFGQTSQPTSAFGQPSALQPTSAFGQPSQPTTSSFGQNNPSTSVFGQPAAGATPSAFGQPASTQTTSVFGQPSQPTSVFGQPSQPTSAFGKPATTTSVFGQPSQPVSAFGASTALTTPSAFGSTTTSTPSAFGAAASTSAFGQPSQPQSSLLKPATGAFGGTSTGGGAFSAFATQPSAFGAPAATTSAFGAPSAFGALAQSAPAPSGSTGAFGTPAPPAGNTVQSAFGAPSAAAPVQSAFGAPAPAPAPVQSAFGAPAGPQSAFGAPTPAPSAFGTLPLHPVAVPRGVASHFPMRPSNTHDPPAKPFHPQGKPDFLNAKFEVRSGANAYDALLPPNYLQLLPKEVKEAFERREFEWGDVPEWVPPIELR